MAIERQDLVTIGSNIAKYRKLKNYTQKELGDILDVNYKTISKWENGNVAPDITLLKSLADVLGISVEELLSGIKVKHKKNKFLIMVNVLLCLLIVFLTGVVIYLKNTKYDFYEFKSNHELFNIEGYVVSGRGESKFLFEDFSYVEKARKATMINEISIMLYNGEEMLFKLDNSFENPVSLDIALEYYLNSEMLNKVIEIFNYKDIFKIKIEYIDSNNNKFNDEINLKTNISKKEK